MADALKFIFSDAWHFVGVFILLVIAVQWKPIDITIINGKVEKQDDERE